MNADELAKAIQRDQQRNDRKQAHAKFRRIPLAKHPLRVDLVVEIEEMRHDGAEAISEVGAQPWPKNVFARCKAVG
jgi:hypothetical protein